MPTPYIRELAKQGHGTVRSLEKHWEAAKKAAASEGKGHDYAYITGVFKKMAGVNESEETFKGFVESKSNV